jgi:CheY-specific phosphatase CheX
MTASRRCQAELVIEEVTRGYLRRAVGIVTVIQRFEVGGRPARHGGRSISLKASARRADEGQGDALHRTERRPVVMMEKSERERARGGMPGMTAGVTRRTSPGSGLAGKRWLLLADGSAIAGRMLPAMRSAGVELLTVLTAAEARWHVRGERLDGIVVLLDQMRPAVSQFLHDVRTSRLNGRTPLAVVADTLDAQGIKWLAAARVDALVLAPAGVEEVLLRLASTLTPARSSARYDVRLINCFLSAARDLLHFYLPAPLEVGRPRVKQGTAAAGFVSGLIGFSTDGHLGSLATTFERSFIDLLAAKVLGDGAGVLDDAAYTDFAGEICNQVLGKAQANFGGLGIAMQMGLPEVAIGDGHALVHRVSSPVIMTPIVHGDTRCVLEFALGAGVSPQIPEQVATAPGPDIELFDNAGSPAES